MNNNSNLEFRKIKSLKFLYEINENGTILRNVKSKKQTKIKLDFHHSKKGYYAAFIHTGGRKNSKVLRVMIHRLVAECWLGDCPQGLEVDHIDRNSHNNHYTNLRYVTKSEQMRNRDHSNISRAGSENLRIAREKRRIPVQISGNNETVYFLSKDHCARYLAQKYKVSPKQIRWKLTDNRSHIYDYDILYFLNAETVHDGSTEQETVHHVI